MAPTHIKGGVWTNVEDEILRAAISKYGLNQWARVSSLLARKTAKQVKARWYEWLDPTVKKVEWSREEDEKLLHLVKLMPSQWRTIAPYIGRTATQCIERYQKLLDDAEQQETASNGLELTGVGADASAPSGARKYRAGDIDPTPESKPARPDAIDMDEDEKEMLSEARARLANTQGKKAKRKDRERILEQSKRLSQLQKRRELKLAGINTKLTKKKKPGQVDYNADIPFEHKPAPGFHDTAEETEVNLRKKANFDLRAHHKGILMRESGSQSEKKRIRDPDVAAAAAEQSAKAKAERLLELNKADQISKRRKLVLPAPQVNEDELERIVKHGSRGDRIREKYLDDESVTNTLVGDYDNEVSDVSARTPLDQRSEDKILQSVREIHAMSNEKSSLLGEATPMRDSSFYDDPASNTFATPNLLKSASETPFRDGLGVNKVDLGATPRELLRRSFASLPKPLNNFDIVVPDEEEDSSINPAEVSNTEIIEDEGERQLQLKRQQEAEYQKALLRRSQVIQRSLPRPLYNNVNTDLKNLQDNSASAELEILQELSKLILSDQIKYSESSHKSKGDTVADLSELERTTALEEIAKELEGKESDVRKVTESFKIEHESKSLVDYDSDPEESSLTLNTLTDTAEKCSKLEKKLSLTMGGYLKRRNMLTKKFQDQFQILDDLRSQRTMFENLRDMESISISTRLNQLQDEVNFLSDAERKGQEKYRELSLSV